MKKYTSCRDRMCGADDCRNCHPGNFIDGVFYEDIPDEEEGEELNSSTEEEQP
jgi:hypothetical protein